MKNFIEISRFSKDIIVIDGIECRICFGIFLVLRRKTGPFQPARAVTACPLQSLPDICYDFFIFIESDCHLLPLPCESICLYYMCFLQKKQSDPANLLTYVRNAVILYSLMTYVRKEPSSCQDLAKAAASVLCLKPYVSDRNGAALHTPQRESARKLLS